MMKGTLKKTPKTVIARKILQQYLKKAKGKLTKMTGALMNTNIRSSS